MPELPEVECVRRSLLHGLIGRAVESVEVRRRTVVVAVGDPPAGFSRTRPAPGRPIPDPAPLTPADLLVGCRIDRIDRRGKQLTIWGAPTDRTASSPRAVMVHLGMTGQLRLEAGPWDAPHTHVVWRLQGRPEALTFRDPRRFGLLRAAPNVAAVDDALRDLGPDALEVTAEHLRAALHGSARPIKAALLDQSVLAGVGNIYADEALWRSGIDPRRPAGRLGPARLGELASNLRAVLAEAIDSGGSTLRDYADGHGRAGAFQLRHAVYGRAGEPCPRCAGVLASAVVAQRTTVWCRRCQPASDRRSSTPRRQNTGPP